MGRFGATVRLAAPADLDAVTDLCLEAREESAVTDQFWSASRDAVRAQLASALDLADLRLLVVELEGVPVGFALARAPAPGPFDETGWLQVEALYVAEASRRRGAGHALMAELGRIALAEGAQRVVTVPLTGSRTERRFLARLGFTAAAARRIADTSSLVRRLGLVHVPRERRPAPGREHLIAARRRVREAAGATHDEPPVGVGAEPSSTQVSRAVQSLR